jgi:glycerophosphoryl diester phosphodiesterase
MIRTPEIIGHRGNPSTQQENTVAGSVEAFKLGATMVENDIYLMRDGNIVVMHDGTIDRTTNGSGDTVAQTAETIKKFKVDAKEGVAAEPIPLLKDYFEEFKGTGEVLVIELKSSDTKIGAPLAKLIKEYGMERQVVIIAFNKNMINSIRAAAPDISVNFLTSGITADENRSLDVAKQIVDNVIPINTAYSPNYSKGTLGIKLFTDLAARGVTVWSWTVNDQAKFNAAYLSGIRGITTNYCQWVSNYVEDFRTEFNEKGELVLKATTYKGTNSATTGAELVVIGGTGTYENKHVTLSDDAEGFSFKIKKTLSNGTSYYLVTPVILAADNVDIVPIPETTEEVTTEAPIVTEPATEPITEPATEPITEPVAEGGCGTMISFSLLALIPAVVLIIKKKED